MATLKCILNHLVLESGRIHSLYNIVVLDSMSGGYYDIDAILSTQQKLPCTFKLDVPGLGHIESTDSKDIKEGARIDLSYWLAELLAIRDTVDIEQPKVFSNRVCNALKADPRSIDLRAQSPYFYSFALKFLEWTDREDLLQIIVDTFRTRVSKLADHAHNPQGSMTEGVEFLRGLDETERALFKAGYDSANQVKKWSERPRDT